MNKKLYSFSLLTFMIISMNFVFANCNNLMEPECQSTQGCEWMEMGTMGHCMASQDTGNNDCALPSSNIKGHLAMTDSGDILYNSPEDIGGFQFVMDGANDLTTVTFTGGDAGTAGLNISSNYNAVNGYLAMAFSMTGGFIPAGCGTLTTFTSSTPISGLSSLIFSDTGANPIVFEYVDLNEAGDGGDHSDDDHDEGPPSCLDDCHDASGNNIFHYLNDDGSPASDMNTICTHLTEIWENGSYSDINQNDANCDQDCAAEDLEILNYYNHMCEGCLAETDADACENWLGNDDMCQGDATPENCNAQEGCHWDDHDGECYEDDECMQYSESDCNAQNDCEWDQNESACYDFHPDCQQYNATNCPTSGCYVNDDGFCKEVDWPSCLSGCSGINDMSPEEPYAFCTWITGSEITNCSSTCDAEILQDINVYAHACNGCLTADPNETHGTCGEWLAFLDDNDGDDGDDNDCMDCDCSGNPQSCWASEGGNCCHNANDCQAGYDCSGVCDGNDWSCHGGGGGHDDGEGHGFNDDFDDEEFMPDCLEDCLDSDGDSFFDVMFGFDPTIINDMFEGMIDSLMEDMMGDMTDFNADCNNLMEQECQSTQGCEWMEMGTMEHCMASQDNMGQDFNVGDMEQDFDLDSLMNDFGLDSLIYDMTDGLFDSTMFNFDSTGFDFDLDEPDLTGVCGWLTEIIDSGGQGGACLSDCTGEVMEELNFFNYMCEGCLAAETATGQAGHCESWLGSDEYCYEYDGDESGCTASLDCEWHADNEECHHLPEDNVDCEQYNDANGMITDCPTEGCHVNDDGFCKEIDWPSCLSGCAGIQDIDPGENADGFCTWIAATDFDNCSSTCDPYLSQQLEAYEYMCAGCHQNTDNDCQAWLAFLEDGDDDCDGGPCGDGDHHGGGGEMADCSLLNNPGECHEAYNCWWDGWWETCFDHDQNWDNFWNNMDCSWEALDEEYKCRDAGCYWDGSSNSCTTATCDLFNENHDPDGCMYANGCYWDGWLQYCLNENFNWDDFNCSHDALDDPGKCNNAGCTWKDGACMDFDHCSEFQMEYDCENYGYECEWSDDGNGNGHCHKDEGGAPDCLSDCTGIENVDGDDGSALCAFLNPIWGVAGSCASDCDQDEDYDELSMIAYLCDGCLAESDTDACDNWFNSKNDECQDGSMPDCTGTCGGNDWSCEMHCHDNTTEDTCPAECEWNAIYGECIEPLIPPCLQGCPNIMTLPNPEEDAQAFCSYLNSTDMDSCSSGCDAMMQTDLSLLEWTCAGCLAEDPTGEMETCDDWLSWLDKDEHGEECMDCDCSGDPQPCWASQGGNCCHETAFQEVIIHGGLNEVLLSWLGDQYADSYNIYRNNELVCNVPAGSAYLHPMTGMPFYLDDGTCGDQVGWGLGYDIEYCYDIKFVSTAENSDGEEYFSYDNICTNTLPQLQAILDLDLSLANAEDAKMAYMAGLNPFGDLTGDGEVDGLIMVKMVNSFPVDGYQFNFNLSPDIAKVVAAYDGTSLMTQGEHGLLANLGPIDSTGNYEPTSNGMLLGFDGYFNGSSIPAGYPGNPNGNEGNLLAVLVLDAEGGWEEEVTATISNFVISAINPLTGASVALNACDADLNPLNGCFSSGTFYPEMDGGGVPDCLSDCSGIENLDGDDGHAVCTFLNSIWDVTDSCASDCGNDEIELHMIADVCSECLTEDADGSTCQTWFDIIFDNDPCKEYSQANCPSNECWWDAHDSMCYSNDEHDNCHMHETEAACPNECEWDAEHDECHHEDGPPDCLATCPNIDTADPGGNPSGFCPWIAATDFDSCGSTCDSDFLEEIALYEFVCTSCMAEDPNGTMGTCEEWLGWITKYEEEYCQEGYDCNGVCGGDDWSCMQEDCPVGYDCNGVCGGDDFSCFDDMGPAITNGCDLPSSNIQGHLAMTASGEILYNTPEDIGGFQFVMDGATETTTITFSGGDAATAGLNINSNYNAVNGYLAMAFSMTGGFIPAGCGTLTTFTSSDLISSLSSLIVSDANAQPIVFEYVMSGTYVPQDSSIPGCMDSSACNYVDYATEDDGSCQYLDCKGDCGGTAVFDDCGTCGGSNDCIHFRPAYLDYSDNPYLPMNIYVTSAELGDIALSAGDEIGIFDGNTCVGSAVLTNTISVSSMLSIVASAQDGDTPGFTAGNSISYRIWDSSDQIEYVSVTADYLQGSSVFANQASAYISLVGSLSIDQDIALTNGWNIISFNVTPDDMDMSNILSGLIDENSLVKVQSETGAAMEYVSFLQTWTNNIGDMANTEGYYVKVNQATTVSTSGSLVNIPLDISLSNGWNIISYPTGDGQDALAALDALIAEGSLVKVQSETGAAIEYISFLNTWNNTIGNFEPGEGYYVKVNQATTLTISEGSEAARIISMNDRLDPMHFQPSHVGNPYMPMNLYITDATIDGKPISHGMEIGIFDGDVCVGSAVFTESLESKESYLSLAVSMDDPTTWNKDGYVPGNEIKVRIFDGSSELEASSDGFAFEQFGTQVMAVDVRTIPDMYVLRANYPNPFNPSTTVSYDLALDGEVSLTVYNMRGEIMSTLVSGHQHAGSHEATWNGMTDAGNEAASGVYFFKLEANDFVQINKAVLIK